MCYSWLLLDYPSVLLLINASNGNLLLILVFNVMMIMIYTL